MTCENCIHLPVCILRMHWGVGSDWNNRYTPDVEKRCKSFKNNADVVKVRCKDCEYKSEWANDGSYPSYNFCKHSGLWCLTDNHFCSYGERKEGAEECFC